MRGGASAFRMHERTSFRQTMRSVLKPCQHWKASKARTEKLSHLTSSSDSKKDPAAAAVTTARYQLRRSSSGPQPTAFRRAMCRRATWNPSIREDL